MKLYCTQSTSPSGGVTKSKWDGTQADAAKRRKEMKADGWKDVDTKEIDVPTSKPKLLAWLNANVTGE